MKRKLLIVIGAMLFLCPLSVKALSGTVGLSCNPTKLNPGSTSTCALTFTTTEDVNSVSAKVSVGSNLTLSSISKDSHWSGDDNSSDILYYGDNIKGTVSIATIKVKAGSITSGASTNITVSNIKIYDSNFNETSFGSKSVTITIPSTVNTLKSLSVSGGSINFSSGTTSYNTTINSASTTISATATDSKAKVSGVGTKSLNYGNNTYKVVVTAESGATKTYTLNITRPDNRSSNNNLSSLSLSSGSISFKASTTSYNVSVGKNVSSVTIKASLADSKSSFVSGYGPRTVTLNSGNNSVQIKVKAENTSVKTYTININRASDNNNTNTNTNTTNNNSTNNNSTANNSGDSKNSNNNLKTLTIINGSISFDKNTTNYNVSVPYEIEEITIKATAESSKSKIEGTGTKELVVGNNTYKVVVIAENGTTKTYTINITRSDSGEVLDDNDKTSNIDVDNKEDIDKTTKKDNSLNVPIIVFAVGALVFLVSLIYRKFKANR